MLSRRKFIAGLFALPIVKKLEPAVRAAMPVAEKVLPASAFVRVEDFFKCGYLWAPYIPLHVTPIDLKRAEEQLAIWRAKFKSPPRFVRKEYYGTITVKDLT